MNNINIIKKTSGAIVMPEGFKAGAAYCGLKSDKQGFDVGIIYSEHPCVAASVFTKNQITAAPIEFCKRTIVDGKVNAIVVNSGNANACTGEQGYKDAETMAELAADHLNLDIDKILVASTGIIGHTLDMDKVSAGISNASRNLSSDLVCGSNVAKAIMTTDLFIKEEAVKVETEDYFYTIGGIAKGSGMISPGMATMLCFITTDANISHSCLNSCLRESVDQSFNRITVDGHMSTNDMAAILANGASKPSKEISSKQDILLFQNALDHVTLNLAKKIVKDGEGATKFVEVDVQEALTEEDAEKIARAIANSPLVKTAINGEDYNWGRIVSAAGYAGVQLDANRLKLFINNILVFNNGMPVAELVKEDAAFQDKLQKEMQCKEINICLNLGLGSENSKVWTCDFSHEYVTINAEYHT
ncbi:MAG: bifunctional glutamate N-acetyltransferase/amino-acid acetyltransferase ArgJ [Candidatus Anammoxibacter sp.]